MVFECILIHLFQTTFCTEILACDFAYVASGSAEMPVGDDVF